MLLSYHLRMLLESQHANESLATEKHVAVGPVPQTPVSWRSSFTLVVQYASPASSGQTTQPMIQPAAAGGKFCGALMAGTVVVLCG